MHLNLELDTITSVIVAISVLFVGQFLVSRITPLRQYNIPVPVIGGLVFACLMAFLQTQTDIRLRFDTDLRGFLMLAFFAGVGLTADLTRLKRGGISLAILLVVVAVFLIIQNAIGA
jgi:ESS family glutamate:Na+ symporter